MTARNGVSAGYIFLVSHAVQTELHSNRLWKSLFRNEFMETAFKVIVFYIGFYDFIKNYIDKFIRCRMICNY